MKVIYIIDSLAGYGAEKSLANIALGFERVEAIFIHLFKGDEMKSALEKQGVVVYSLNLDSKISFKAAMHLVIPIVRDENPDIIHSTLFKADMVARGIKSKFPNIVFVGSFVSNSYSKNRYRQLDILSRFKLFSTQIRDRISISKVDYIISNSQSILETNVKALKVPKKKVEVIYRGRNLENKRISSENVKNIKRELGLVEGQTVFLNIGRLHKGKGQIDLVQAFKGLVKEVPNMVLLIAGEGSLRKELEDLIYTSDLQEKVILLGYYKDIPKLLALADYFVFPSYYEGLSGALIEAILAKKPCLVSDIPENRECFLGEEALFFPPGDIVKLGRKILEALEINDWEERTLRAQNNAQKKFSIKKVSKDYEKFYFKIAEE